MSGELGDGFWYCWLNKGGMFAGGGGGILARMAGLDGKVGSWYHSPDMYSDFV
jgi:hypothetical protein